MSLVTITYNVWDMNRAVIPAASEPQIMFRPIMSSLATGLLTDREVYGSLSLTTGAGSVRLESAPGLFFVPIVTWLKNPEDPNNRARGSTEWEMFFPDRGGNISDLRIYKPEPGQIYHGYGPPPTSMDNALYIDRSGAKPVLWGPSRGGI